MTIFFLYLASFLSALTCLAHIFVGGPKNAAPILGLGDLPLGPKTTMTFSWNAASLLLASIAVGYLVAALQGGESKLVWFLTLLSAAHAILGVWVSWRSGVNPLTFPPAMLFVVMAAAGGLALATA